ncbi:hypothetical protein D9C73_023072 [Collichthys lucidus]|uniref:Uncharacterized protein n=1 Tax=Collichthys lucidus TaxID=240159 RepID=A0A4U5VJN2_COLLU|nr:hypothetical protein D9C73_023072 [Collichthys lucidus]
MHASGDEPSSLKSRLQTLQPVARITTTAPRCVTGAADGRPPERRVTRAKGVEERAAARCNGTEPKPLNGSDAHTHTHTLGRITAKWQKRARSELCRIRCED